MERQSKVQPCWAWGDGAMQWDDATADVRCTDCGAIHPSWDGSRGKDRKSQQQRGAAFRQRLLLDLLPSTL